VTTSHLDPHRPRLASIADPFDDLLSTLDPDRRRGLVQRLAVGFYEGWRPTRDEVAGLVASEGGRIEHLRSSSSPHPVGAAGTTGNGPGHGPGQTRQPQPATNRQSFTIDCGKLAPPFHFVACGLSHDGILRRAGRPYQLVSLQYELVPADLNRIKPNPPRPFTARITCVPNIAAPLAEVDERSKTDRADAGHGPNSRGPWPLPPGVRQLSFLIYPQLPPTSQPARRPAGALIVDIRRHQAHWLPTARGRPLTGPPS
jgi:hypothetical protein